MEAKWRGLDGGEGSVVVVVVVAVGVMVGVMVGVLVGVSTRAETGSVVVELCDERDDDGRSLRRLSFRRLSFRRLSFHLRSDFRRLRFSPTPCCELMDLALGGAMAMHIHGRAEETAGQSLLGQMAEKTSPDEKKEGGDIA